MTANSRIASADGVLGWALSMMTRWSWSGYYQDVQVEVDLTDCGVCSRPVWLADLPEWLPAWCLHPLGLEPV